MRLVNNTPKSGITIAKSVALLKRYNKFSLYIPMFFIVS